MRNQAKWIEGRRTITLEENMDRDTPGDDWSKNKSKNKELPMNMG
jgi:hypothetical protein